MHFGVRITLFACAALAAAPAFAQAPRPKPPPPAASGTAVAVIPATHAKGPGGNRTLEAGKDVFGGDTISTTEAGQAQILFNDKTKLVVGPDSSVVIDSFVFNADGSASGAAMQFTRGAFRFITGTGKSDAYTLQTPTASIGIRGTQFDIAVGSQGTAVIVFKGAVEVCHRATRECATLRRSCSAAIATTDGKLNVPKRSEPRDGLINAAFPLVKEQKTLRKDFRVFTGGCGMGGGAKGVGGGSGGKKGGGRNRGGGNGKGQ